MVYNKGMWIVDYYETESGSAPAEEYIKTLDAKTRAKVHRQIGLLQSVGKELRMPYSRYMEDGILELRISTGNEIRIFYFFTANKKIILTNGFTKKTQKTPAKELDKAKKYKSDYEQRGL
ncbi:MAG: type II toxin-antitoxin system RelE/ParE family toxin [Firmicutes bacterium]|nr:type II toxin-antitoxin system RelE/ParE family toxin [Bacillota bacterium]